MLSIKTSAISNDYTKAVYQNCFATNKIYTIYTYVKALADLGCAEGFFESEYDLNTNPISFIYWKKKYSNVTKAPLIMQESFSLACMQSELITIELGYHIFATSIVIGNHTLGISIKYVDVDQPVFYISDHHVDGTKEFPEADIDKRLDVHTLSTWEFCYAKFGRKENTKVNIWKTSHSK